MKVAVLGCGPSGLLAALAAYENGAGEVKIFSKARKSNMFGAQYLHKPIPGITNNSPNTLHYVLKGDSDEYRSKVYGEDWDGSVSPAEFEGDHSAWDIREMYDNLWSLFGSEVIDKDITPQAIDALDQGGEYDYIFSTVPSNNLCVMGHTFAGQSIWAAGDSHDLKLPMRAPLNTVICNGEKSPSWYRLSNVFGWHTCEWPEQSKPPIPCAEVVKPLFNNCTCWRNVIRMGRFGRWEKGILVHHVYEEVGAVLQGHLDPMELRPHLHPCPLVDEELSSDVREQMGCRCA